MNATKARIAEMPKNARRRLSRCICMLCETQLSRGNCGSIFGPKCTDEQMLARIDSCLADYKPREAGG